MRDVVRVALIQVAARFSDDAPSVDALTRALRVRYRALDGWPADPQLGLAVLGWVLGPGFALVGFRQSLNRLVPDFRSAAQAVGVGTNPTLVTIGGIVRCALRNGAVVTRWNLDPEVLYWPLDLSACAGAR